MQIGKPFKGNFMTEEERIHALEVFTDMIDNPMVYTECSEADLRTAIEALEKVKVEIQN